MYTNVVYLKTCQHFWHTLDITYKYIKRQYWFLSAITLIKFLEGLFLVAIFLKFIFCNTATIFEEYSYKYCYSREDLLKFCTCEWRYVRDTKNDSLREKGVPMFFPLYYFCRTRLHKKGGTARRFLTWFHRILIYIYHTLSP